MNLRKDNKVIRVNFSGGLLGMIFGSHRGKLQKSIEEQNQQGWNYVDCIADDPNLILLLLRLILLVVTLGLWTIGVGYILIFERPKDVLNSPNQNEKPSGPILSARR
jgi:hypothetical protein